jgi:hypothetical protein
VQGVHGAAPVTDRRLLVPVTDWAVFYACLLLLLWLLLLLGAG